MNLEKPKLKDRAIVFSDLRVHILNQVLIILDFGSREKPKRGKELGKIGDREE